MWGQHAQVQAPVSPAVCLLSALPTGQETQACKHCLQRLAWPGRVYQCSPVPWSRLEGRTCPHTEAGLDTRTRGAGRAGSESVRRPF